jgi:DNA-binding NarL/FixJ family response regulator
MSFSAAVADPHDLARLGTTHLLKRLGGHVITDDEDGVPPPDALLDRLSAGTLDLLVIDSAAPEGPSPKAGGTQLLRRARADGHLGPSAAADALVLTREDDEDAVREAFRLGATGYALKSDPIDEIEAAVTTVLRGERHLSETLPERWMDEAVVAGADLSAQPASAEAAGTDETEALSDREREVLRLTAQGLTKREVGRSLSISYRAVETCRRNIQEKLCLGDQVEMVRYAARSGLL